MEKLIALMFCMCVLNAHCAVYGTKDKHLHREGRSPHYVGQNFFGPPPPGLPPPPPPPPFLYHTHNWSGVSRGYGGRSNGVFSGAAIEAVSSQPTNGEALALATADGFSRQSENCDDAASNNLGQSSQFGAKSEQVRINQRGSAQNGGQIKSSGREFTDSQSGGLQAGFAGSNSNSAAGRRSLSRGSGNSRSEDFGGHLGEYKSHSSSFSSSSSGSGFSSNGQQNNGFNTQASGINSGVSGSNGGFQRVQNYNEAHLLGGHGGQRGAQQNNGATLSHGGLSGNQQAGNQGTAETKGLLSNVEDGVSSGFSYGHRGEHGRSEQLQSGGNFGQGGQEESSASGASGAAHGNAYSAFKGALGLASQGLQAADKAGCSTCQKSSYALSNAKSYNGNAISLAIGG